MIIKKDRAEQQAIRDAERAWDQIVKDLLSKHESIFFSELGNGFIYKPIPRKEYRKIVLSDEIPVIQKEDEICAMSVLYPENVDWDDMDAGIPTLLCQEIIKNSYLEDVNDIADLIEIFRQDLIDLPAQMACVISEAFPNYDMDEIESWDMIKFCRIFTRAEWKIKNLRDGDKINSFGDVTDVLRGAIGEGNDIEEETPVYQQQPQQPQPRQVQPQQAKPQNDTKTVKVGNREMSVEEYQQYLEFQRKFPEIAWDKDSMYTGAETMSYNNLPVALRPLS